MLGFRRVIRAIRFMVAPVDATTGCKVLSKDGQDCYFRHMSIRNRGTFTDDNIIRPLCYAGCRDLASERNWAGSA